MWHDNSHSHHSRTHTHTVVHARAHVESSKHGCNTSACWPATLHNKVHHACVISTQRPSACHPSTTVAATCMGHRRYVLRRALIAERETTVPSSVRGRRLSCADSMATPHAPAPKRLVVVRAAGRAGRLLGLQKEIHTSKSWKQHQVVLQQLSSCTTAGGRVGLC